MSLLVYAELLEQLDPDSLELDGEGTCTVLCAFPLSLRTADRYRIRGINAVRMYANEMRAFLPLSRHGY